VSVSAEPAERRLLERRRGEVARLFSGLQERVADAVNLDTIAEACLISDDALDAVICALVARLARGGERYYPSGTRSSLTARVGSGYPHSTRWRA
jgi:hypothetical protein